MTSWMAVVGIVRAIGRRDEDAGQDLLEYGILMALIAIVAMAGVSALGQQIHQVFWQTIVNTF